MAFHAINPVDGSTILTLDNWEASRLSKAMDVAELAAGPWADTPIKKRCELMYKAAEVLRARQEELATIITQEMGKLIKESRGEIEKCAWVCEYYAEHGPGFLEDEYIETDAAKSLVAYQPLGIILAVMPWNFPFWQVFRFAAPALVAGNTGLLKHASNVPQCAQAIESVFKEAGFPVGVFTTLMIGSVQVRSVIDDPRVKAVTLTGSEPAGKSVAEAAGANIKKSVLELGGSDAFIVLDDADLELAVKQGVTSRYMNGGQSCIAAKRFIVVDAIADAFLEKFKAAVEDLRTGDPMSVDTTLAPMARHDLRDELHKQVIESIEAGAKVVTGCAPEAGSGAYYQASIIDHVKPGMRAWHEELFGPVAIVIRAKNEDDAVSIANSNDFGLGGSVWTQSNARGERVARQLQCGAAFVNGLVKSDPRMPFGGIKLSGYGRELSHHGIREFVNAKTIWIK